MSIHTIDPLGKQLVLATMQEEVDKWVVAKSILSDHRGALQRRPRVDEIPTHVDHCVSRINELTRTISDPRFVQMTRSAIGLKYWNWFSI